MLLAGLVVSFGLTIFVWPYVQDLAGANTAQATVFVVALGFAAGAVFRSRGRIQ